LACNPYRAWIEMYGGEEYQAISADAVRLLERVGERRGADSRFDALARIFREATLLEADFWQMGLAAGE
jgi:thiaminase/transcriptional activator TenA